MAVVTSESRLMVLMFTDLVGSMELKSKHGVPVYAELIARHDQLFHHAMKDEGGDGAEILQDTGDGYFARFPTVTSAVRCALRFQHDLAREPWEPAPVRVRVGIHLGETAEVRREAGMAGKKITGLSVDLTARIMGLATGGQILMTRFAFNEARQFVSEHPPLPTETAPPPPLQWIAHGNYIFKGMADPSEVYEVGAVGLAPLSAPPDSEKAKREVVDPVENTLGWRPAIGLPIPDRHGWQLEKKLGEGGFGEVWLGRQDKLRTQRVFKFCFDPDRLRSFKREITLFRLLRDIMGDRDDIARLHDVKLDASPYFLESEYTEGGNLADWAATQGGIEKVPLATRLDLVARVATALQAAHSAGILHKDIKPTNILVYEDPSSGQPRPRLADFGIGMIIDRSALKAHNITDVGFTLIDSNESSRTGTRMYAPPETLGGKPFTAQGDIFAMGVFLYQMVIGDIERPLATGWDREVHDELLREDIRACVDGNPGRRLHAPEEIAARLNTLPARHNKLKRDRLIRSGRIGVVMVGLLIAAQIAGWLGPLEQFCYDRRAAICQFSTPKPTDRIVHLDIDDAAITTVGHWPWPREDLARILDELRLAGPKAVGLDIEMGEPQPVRVMDVGGQSIRIEDDADLAASLGRLKCGVLATSFTLTPPPATSADEAYALDQLNQNLEMTREQFETAMAAHGFHSESGESVQNLFIRLRRKAMHERIFAESRDGSIPRADLITRLLPHTDPTIQSPLLRTLDEEATQIEAAKRLATFGVLCPTLPVAPVDGIPAVIALPQFTQNAMGCGFINFDQFNDAVLTSIPLLVQYDHHLYPQLGMVFGLIMMNADIRSARIDNDQITVPRPDGPDVVIPSGFYRSQNQHREVSFINDIPWFGGSDWQTIYDWPKHKKPLNHASINVVWDLCLLGERIKANSRNIDDGILYVLSKVDPDKFDAYRASPPAVADFAARDAAATATLKALDDVQYIQGYQKQNNLSADEKSELERLLAARKVMEGAPKLNHALQDQLDQQRSALAALVHDKGVLIGAVYDANGDVVNTPLQERSPGVVAQGVIANAVMIGRWWREAPLWVGIVLIALFGLFAAFIDARVPAIWASLLILSLSIFYLLLNGLLLFGVLTWVVPVAGPMVALLGVWLLCNLGRIIRPTVR
jgi:serine/threonine protein kinase/class 3 adenylate cyclase